MSEPIETEPNAIDPGDKETYHEYSVDDEDQPQSTGDDLAEKRGLSDPLDEGYSPKEKWSAGQGYGNTPREEELGESLDQRVRQEVEEPDPYAEAEAMTTDEIEGNGDETGGAGAQRAGRLVAPDEGAGPDEEAQMVGEDVGIDGAAAGAEEAAVHVVDPEDDL